MYILKIGFGSFSRLPPLTCSICLSVAWLQGTRAFEVSGCAACGTTVLLMLAYLAMPSDEAQAASTGFTVANLTAGKFVKAS